MAWSGWGHSIHQARAGGQGVVAVGIELAALLSGIWAVSGVLIELAPILSATTPPEADTRPLSLLCILKSGLLPGPVCPSCSTKL